MSNTVRVSKLNEVFMRVDCDDGLARDLFDFFSFSVPNAKFMPSVKNRYWDGKVRLFSIKTNKIYIGLLPYVDEFCRERGYNFEGIHDVIGDKTRITDEDVNFFVNGDGLIPGLGLPFQPRDYQIEGIYDALKCNRRLIVSPTGSGKSLMIYALSRYHAEQNKKVLIVVPTTSLVEQMYKDFYEYGWDVKTNCHRIYAGKDLFSKAPVIISTWQSLYKQDKKWFRNFSCVIGDEAHQFKSKSLMSIMTKLDGAKYRYGFTGTLDGSQTHKWVLEGLFGSSYKIVNTKDLQEAGYLAKLNIKVLILKHDPQEFEVYEDEIKYLISHERRNKFIKNLVHDLKGNTLVLYSRVATHGQVLFDLINTNSKRVFFVHGGVDTEERETVREIVESENDAIIVASFGTFSTGINIKNLHNVVFSSPSKSRIRTLQSIGRVLRKGDAKVKATLYDIADDCKKGSKQNYTLNHLIERIKYYNEEKFNYEIIQLGFGKK